MRKLFVGIGIILILIAAFVINAQAAMKTLSRATPTLDQDWILATTGYNYTCGPVSATEVMAYWALNGFPNLMPAPPSGAIPDKSSQIINLFHSMRIYTTYDNNGYITTADSQLISELKSFLTLKGYSGTVELAGFGKVTFNRIKSEIDAGRPVMLLVMGWYHWVVIKGYDSTTQQLRVLWGHDINNNLNFERTVNFSDINATDPDPETGANAVYIRVGSSSTCTYNISPTSASVGSAATTGTISMTAPSGCSWSASTGVPLGNDLVRVRPGQGTELSVSQ